MNFANRLTLIASDTRSKISNTKYYYRYNIKLLAFRIHRVLTNLSAHHLRKISYTLSRSCETTYALVCSALPICAMSSHEQKSSYEMVRRVGRRSTRFIVISIFTLCRISAIPRDQLKKEDSVSANPRTHLAALDGSRNCMGNVVKNLLLCPGIAEFLQYRDSLLPQNHVHLNFPAILFDFQ